MMTVSEHISEVVPLTAIEDVDLLISEERDMEALLPHACLYL